MDGSEQSVDAALYAAKILPADRAEMVLFHVLDKIPETYWDLEKFSPYRRRVIASHAWEMQQQQKIQDVLNRTRDAVVFAGFPEDAVKVVVQGRRVGTARDIAFEALQEYDGVVVGRTGTSQLKDLVMGSIANKLVGRLEDAPICVVGGKPEVDKLLVAMDHSPGAMKCVDYVARMLAGSKCHVTLAHVIRALPPMGQEAADEGFFQAMKEEVGRAREQMEFVMEDARSRLLKAGFAREKVDLRMVSDVPSRAVALVEEARAGGCGGIVTGRRGLSRIQEFFMGRVSNKVLQLARDMAVWVVS